MEKERGQRKLKEKRKEKVGKERNRMGRRKK